MIHGIDVSHHQHDLDWPTVAADDIAFVYIKLTEGVGYVDPAADDHLSGATNAGLATGLYHFARPDTNSPGADAAHFATHLDSRQHPRMLPACLDLEERSPGSLTHIDLAHWTAEFLDELRTRTGQRTLMLYGSSSFLRDRLDGLTWLDEFCLTWIAHYDVTPGDPGWTHRNTVMHQYTNSGRISGYPADIDRNVCWADLTELTHPSPTIDGPQPAPEPDTRTRSTHLVRPGETLSGIAEQYQLDHGWRGLYDANRDLIGPDPSMIYPGMRLHLPDGQHSRRHTVTAGDTLSQIAVDYDLDGGWRALYTANREIIGDDPGHLEPGMRLRIP